MNNNNEQRENQNLVQPRQQQQRKQKKNPGKKILIGSFFVTAFLMVVIAFTTSVVAISQSNQMPVKYTTYERIGNIECPKTSGTSLIYRGVTISYSYNSTQNAPTSYSGFRCMPLDSEDIAYNTDDSPFEEDQVYSGNVTGYITFTKSNEHDAACAVCIVEGRGTIVVLPGTNKCKDLSWTMEYYGYLMTGNTCVDIQMDYLPDSRIPDAFLRHEVMSSKVSEHYHDHQVLSCVVCSK